MRDYIIRFWKRMINKPFNIPLEDVQKLIDISITQDEYDAIVAQ